MKTYLRPVVRSLPLFLILTFLLPASAWCADQPAPQRQGFFARLFARSSDRSSSARASGPRVVMQKSTTLTAFESSPAGHAPAARPAGAEATLNPRTLTSAYAPGRDTSPTTSPSIETVSTSSIQPTIETVSTSAPTQAAATATPAKTFPMASYLSYGRVQVPFPPYSTLDVEGLASGSLAKDPVSGKVFRVP